MISFLSYGQKRNSIWCFGDSAGIDFNIPGNPQPISTTLRTRGSCVSIADTSGSLLFYANTRASTPGQTTQVRNRNNQIMPNGTNIVGQGWYNELLIIPKPGDSLKYYLLTVGVAVGSTTGFYYSIIDMSLDFGLGAVLQKNILIDTTDLYYDALGAVKHGNGKDWWIISKRYSATSSVPDNRFEIFLITSDSIYHSFQNIGSLCYGGLGNITFTKDGSRFLFTTRNGTIEVFDFNRCSGVLSNPKIIHTDNFAGDYPYYWGGAFSPNQNLIYVSSSDDTSRIYQFDLTAANIWNSRDTIYELIYPTQSGGQLRLAPDDKIYWSCWYYNSFNNPYPYADTMRNVYNENLSVINDPDMLGSACNFTPFSFYLGGKRAYIGLPNNPDYDMGALVGSPCDTITGVTNIVKENHTLSVYPNPSNGIFYISPNGVDKIDMVEVRNYLGEIVFSGKENTRSINLSSVRAGIYLYSIRTKDGRVYTGKLVKK
jgi:hypothetical protein